MTISVYQNVIPLLVKYLTNLSSLLRKGEAHATLPAARDELLQARLIADMHPLVYQIYPISIMVTGLARRVGGRADDPAAAEPPDDVAGFEGLQARLAALIDLLASLDPETVADMEDKDLVFELNGRTLSFTGADYAVLFVVPNVLFHVNMSYAIMRSRGVQIGKWDYLGPTGGSQ